MRYPILAGTQKDATHRSSWSTVPDSFTESSIRLCVCGRGGEGPRAAVSFNVWRYDTER